MASAHSTGRWCRGISTQKPASSISPGLYEKITGRTGSSGAIGHFVSGYCHSGWWGSIVASVMSGWVVAQTPVIARDLQDARALAMPPFSLLGLRIALGVEGDFISGFLGTFTYIADPLAAAGMLIGVAAPESRPGGRP